MEPYTFTPVAVVRSCFKTKFGIPRQPGLVPEATGEIVFQPPCNQPNAVRGLESFSHIWVLFVFHENIRQEWKATVRPPRLGGDRRVGVFASRSPFRPCPIGMSVLKLNDIICRGPKVALSVSGLDLLDGTPVLDVKPYVTYVDSIPDATSGFAPNAPDPDAMAVTFTPEAAADCNAVSRCIPGFTDLVRKLIAANPRPAYQHEDGRAYSLFLHEYEVLWQADQDTASVIEIRKL